MSSPDYNKAACKGRADLFLTIPEVSGSGGRSRKITSHIQACVDICRACPIQKECLYDNRDAVWGVFGGVYRNNLRYVGRVAGEPRYYKEKEFRPATPRPRATECNAGHKYVEGSYVETASLKHNGKVYLMRRCLICEKRRYDERQARKRQSKNLPNQQQPDEHISGLSS